MPAGPPEQFRRGLFSCSGEDAVLDLDALVSATEAAGYAHVSVAAVVNWRNRGHLPVATDKAGREIRDGRGRPRYRLRDVARADIETRRRAEQMARGLARRPAA
jgi:hypothetical protein